MELKTLRYFTKIVELGSLSQAAQALFIAQPALSHQVAALEKELEVRLLDRNPKGVKPTAAGVALYRSAISILRQVEQIRQQVKAEDGSVIGDVSFGVPTSTAAVLAMPLLEAVIRRYPKIKLEINENGSGLLAEWLVHGRLDLAILFTEGPLKSIRVMHLLTEELCLVAPPTHSNRRVRGRLPLDTVNLQEISATPLVIPSRANGLRHFIDEAFSQSGIQPNVVAELSMLHTLKAAVLGGLAATILPMSAVSEEWHAGCLLVKRIVEPAIARPMSLCSNSNIPLSSAAGAVHAIAVEVIHRLVQDGIWPGVEAAATHCSE
jgi:LysR family nitrogen assimilation transcriptional regulator